MPAQEARGLDAGQRLLCNALSECDRSINGGSHERAQGGGPRPSGHGIDGAAPKDRACSSVTAASISYRRAVFACRTVTQCSRWSFRNPGSSLRPDPARTHRGAGRDLGARHGLCGLPHRPARGRRRAERAQAAADPGHEIVARVLAVARGSKASPWAAASASRGSAGRAGPARNAAPAGRISAPGALHRLPDRRRLCRPRRGRCALLLCPARRLRRPAAAPLLCAGLIGWRSLVKTGEANRLGIYGFGAAAHIVAQVARHQGREIYAFTRGRSLSQGVCSLAGRAGPARRRRLELDAAILFAPVGELVPQALRLGVDRRVRRHPHERHSVISLQVALGRTSRVRREFDAPGRGGVSGISSVRTCPNGNRVVSPGQANEALAALRSGRLRAPPCWCRQARNADRAFLPMASGAAIYAAFHARDLTRANFTFPHRRSRRLIPNLAKCSAMSGLIDCDATMSLSPARRSPFMYLAMPRPKSAYGSSGRARS